VGRIVPPPCAGRSLQDCSLRAGLAVLPGHADTSPKSRMSLEATAVQQPHLSFKNPGRHIKKGAGSWHSTMGYRLFGHSHPHGAAVAPHSITLPAQPEAAFVHLLCCLRGTGTAPCLPRGVWSSTGRSAACPQGVSCPLLLATTC